MGEKSIPIQWHETRTAQREKYWYALDPYGAYDGDEARNEWKCGYSIRPDRSEDMTYWDVYEDDGLGNGGLINTGGHLEEAKKIAQEHADRRAGLLK